MGILKIGLSKVRSVLLVAALCLVTAPAVHAQEIRLTPFVGYRFFGSLTDYYGNNISSNDAMSFGGFVSFMSPAGTGIELGYSRQDTDVVISAPFLGRERYDVKIDHWSLAGVREVRRPNSSLTPFGTGFLGFSRMSSSDGDGSLSKFLLGLSGGALIAPPTSPVGLRLEARGYFTLAGGGGASVGCGTGGCGFGFGSEAFFQMDLLAGLSFRFGGRR
jgi:hypothetical protein